MNYEQKYKEVLERAKRELQTCGSKDCDAARQIYRFFPELQESEDERIRKMLIKFFSQGVEYNSSTNGIYDRDIVAWLEKQGGKPQGKTALEAAKEEKVDNQNCVKPVDKAEPKFHEGDWVTNSIETVQITGYDIDYGYQVNYKGKLLHRDTDIIEKEYHLWTIKDAKPGDVLSSGHLVFIFKVIHGVWLNCHCSAHNDGSFIADSYDLMTNKYFSEVHPATKEQRDTLTKAMANAGWEFDFDKKELRKIEQNLASSAKNCKNDTLLDLLNKMPSYITVDGLDYHFVLKKIGVYIAYYECEGEEGRDKIIFWMAGDPVDLLTAMLEKLKEKGLLE